MKEKSIFVDSIRTTRARVSVNVRDGCHLSTTDPAAGSTVSSLRSRKQCSRCSIVSPGQRQCIRRCCAPHRRLLGAGLAVEEKHRAGQEAEEPRRPLRRAVRATGPENDLLSSFRGAFRRSEKPWDGAHPAAGGQGSWGKHKQSERIATKRPGRVGRGRGGSSAPFSRHTDWWILEIVPKNCFGVVVQKNTVGTV